MLYPEENITPRTPDGPHPMSRSHGNGVYWFPESGVQNEWPGKCLGVDRPLHPLFPPIKITPYHSQGHSIIPSMLGTLTAKKKQHCSKHISAVMYAYKSTVNDAIGYSWYMLIFGRETQFLMNLTFSNSVAVHRRYVDQLRNLKSAFEKAQAVSDVWSQHKRNRDLRVKSSGCAAMLSSVAEEIWVSSESANYLTSGVLTSITKPIKDWCQNYLLPLSEAFPIYQWADPRLTRSHSSRQGPMTRSQTFSSTKGTDDIEEGEDVNMSWLWPF